jgi:hypothetical protein
MIPRYEIGIKSALEIARQLRKVGYTLQRVNRGKWLVSDDSGIVVSLRISLDENHPDKVIYVENIE